MAQPTVHYEYGGADYVGLGVADEYEPCDVDGAGSVSGELDSYVLGDAGDDAGIEAHSYSDHDVAPGD